MSDRPTPIYLDCAATTPIDPRVAEIVRRYMEIEYGNAGSRTHEFGAAARRAVEKAREQVGAVVGAGRGEVIFTSGATEANNLALLGLAEHGLKTGRTHIVSTLIEHHAVLEPLRVLESRGFTVDYVPPTRGGWIEPRAVRAAVTDRTLLVSVMQVNNETGIVQPVDQIAEALADHPAYFHVDAAQGFGKVIEPQTPLPALRERSARNAPGEPGERETLGGSAANSRGNYSGDSPSPRPSPSEGEGAGALRHSRIDLISVSGHKLFAPKGVGALIARRRDGQRPPLSPLMFGGGQELGLRPGTLPVALIAGFGLAAELAVREAANRAAACMRFRQKLLAALAPLRPIVHGDPAHTVPHIVNLSFPGLDNETAIDALRDVVAISDGAACTAASYTCSHVLSAMSVSGADAAGAIRLSWYHGTAEPDWPRLVEAIARVQTQPAAH